MDDTEIYDDNCPKCDGVVYRRQCSAIGCDDGYYDSHEYDDPLWFDPGEMVLCEECSGKGYFVWCCECGYDLLAKENINVPSGRVVQGLRTAVILAIFLTSCGGDSYTEANILNATNANKAYLIICIDGIEYVRTHAGISGHFKEDGSLHTCLDNGH